MTCSTSSRCAAASAIAPSLTNCGRAPTTDRIFTESSSRSTGSAPLPYVIDGPATARGSPCPPSSCVSSAGQHLGNGSGTLRPGVPATRSACPFPGVLEQRRFGGETTQQRGDVVCLVLDGEPAAHLSDHVAGEGAAGGEDGLAVAEVLEELEGHGESAVAVGGDQKQAGGGRVVVLLQLVGSCVHDRHALGEQGRVPLALRLPFLATH